ncbi:hypothetical protein VN97_g6398 [Penicillium thymicola]|uniref:Uncharacterized protein n=1 Tax=Penicillium thymicola TaxID=293382 RepID=A0AAI9TGH4_PENTH|nr:hypothetical protein VN97_g6398 [Penicillium thymicola]
MNSMNSISIFIFAISVFLCFCCQLPINLHRNLPSLAFAHFSLEFFRDPALNTLRTLFSCIPNWSSLGVLDHIAN